MLRHLRGEISTPNRPTSGQNASGLLPVRNACPFNDCGDQPGEPKCDARIAGGPSCWTASTALGASRWRRSATTVSTGSDPEDGRSRERHGLPKALTGPHRQPRSPPTFLRTDYVLRASVKTMADTLQYQRVVFKRFKAFDSFTLHLRHFNIMVGPNNAGKSTILAAFRILAAGLRRANKRNPQYVNGPEGITLGHPIDLRPLSIGEENIFFNYDESEPASVTFTLTGNKKLLLYFPERESCLLIPDDPHRSVLTASRFRSSFNCPIGFVPILGPVEHHERLYAKEAARLALFNYRAARNFRNIWYHYDEHFDSFRALLRQTWPGMDIEPPEVDRSHEKPVLHMYCPEGEYPERSSGQDSDSRFGARCSRISSSQAIPRSS